MEIFNRRILVVDDQPKWADMIASILTEQGYSEVTTKYGTKKYADLLCNYDLAILDIKMKPIDGFKIKRYLQCYSPGTQVILTSQFENYGLDLIEKARGVSGWMTKQDIVKDNFSFIMLVNRILEQKSQNTTTGCSYDLFSNIVLDQRNEFGIQTQPKIRITEILQNLKANLIKAQCEDHSDFSFCVDALAVALSKRKKDLNAVTLAFHAIQEQGRRAPDDARTAMIDDLKEILLKLNLLSRPKNNPNGRIFIVHGHDEVAKLTVANFLKELKLQPVILSEQPNKGKAIIEKFEQNSDVGYAVALLTPDDCAYVKDAPDRQTFRARQNVILELGYFIGRLGRDKVCVLYKEELEIPSDIHGVLYIPMDPNGGWKMQLVQEMKYAGVPVKLYESLQEPV